MIVPTKPMSDDKLNKCGALNKEVKFLLTYIDTQLFNLCF